MYADDTVIYFTARNAEDIGNELSNELANVNNWLEPLPTPRKNCRIEDCHLPTFLFPEMDLT